MDHSETVGIACLQQQQTLMETAETVSISLLLLIMLLAVYCQTNEFGVCARVRVIDTLRDRGAAGERGANSVGRFTSLHFIYALLLLSAVLFHLLHFALHFPTTSSSCHPTDRWMRPQSCVGSGRCCSAPSPAPFLLRRRAGRGSLTIRRHRRAG